MKKSIIIILAVVAILVIWAVSVYNGLVTMDENVSGQWANVETQYQRRADLIPNLVNTVKGYAICLTWFSVINFVVLVAFILYSLGVFNF